MVVPGDKIVKQRAGVLDKDDLPKTVAGLAVGALEKGWLRTVQVTDYLIQARAA